MFANIVHEQRSNGTTVVGRGDGPVTLLARGIPYLSFDCFWVDLDRARSEFDTTLFLVVKSATGGIEQPRFVSLYLHSGLGV